MGKRQELANVDETIIIMDGYDDAIIGHTETQVGTNLAVYDSEKIIGILMDRDGMGREDAEEFYEYNIVRSLPYHGNAAPILTTVIEEEKVAEFKYTLIISQYHHSYHMFIVEHDFKFIERARAFALELMEYKRGKDDYRNETYLGDLSPKWSDGPIRPRYNLNDAGDIYFIQSNYANFCKDEVLKYMKYSTVKGYQKKDITQAIDDHHNYRAVKEMVEKHFQIA